jgi:UDP-glucose 4-epimerase
MKVVVTGGAGFIGSHLVDALVSANHDVVVIDALSPRESHRNAKAQYVQMNILDEKLHEVFADVKPEIVFHFAAHIDDRASVSVALFNARENILGSLNVFEAARLSGQVKKFLFPSTSVVYGNADRLAFTEKVLPHPLTPYGISKLACEDYLHFYYKTYGIPFVALRLGNIYGPRQDSSKECGAIAIFIDKLLKHEPPFMNNDGETVRDYLYVADVVDIFMKAMDSGAVGVYNCGTGKGTTARGLYTIVKESLHSDLEPVPRPEVQDQVRRSIMRSTLARKTFGWKPKMTLKRGIKKTLKWYKERV